MPDRRPNFKITTRSPTKTLLSRHYPTYQQRVRFVHLQTTLSSRRRNAQYRPQIETLHLDTKVNPFLHDFDVRLKHGEKTSYFRVFLKRGKRILANQCAVAPGLVGEIVIMRLSAASAGTTLVNSRTSDGAIMDYVLRRARYRIRNFQQPKRNALPAVLKLTRARAFPGAA